MLDECVCRDVGCNNVEGVTDKRGGFDRGASTPLPEIPTSLPEAERQRRAAILHDIACRLAEGGPHVAAPSPDRARQFMPFAALRGYGDAIADSERDLLFQDRREITDEDAIRLSKSIAAFQRGSKASVTIYSEPAGGYRTVAGIVEEVVIPLRRMRIGGAWVDFRDIVDV